jgi:hypothetical protein
MNILSLVSQNLDNFYQIQTKCYRNSDTVFFSPIHQTKGGLDERFAAEQSLRRRQTRDLDYSILGRLWN